MFKTEILIIFCILSIKANNTFDKYPSGEVGRMVKLGEKLVNNTNTNPLTKNLIDCQLTCKNCHLSNKSGKAGTTLHVGTFIGTAASFPAYSKEHKKVINLEDEINDCFLICMGGKKSIIGTKQGMAISAYIAWLSTGQAAKMNTKEPMSQKITNLWEKKMKIFYVIQKRATHKNYINGKKLYHNKCAFCHGENGKGIADFPPLWGKDIHGTWLSYGAYGNMANLQGSAIWIQENMPFKQPRTLTNQQAANIALYINAQERAPYKGFDVKDIFKKLDLNLTKIKEK